MIYIISEKYIQENSGLGEDVDYRNIKPILEEAQLLHLTRLLGTDLYNAVQNYLEDFIDNGTPIPAPYDELINTYCSKILLNRVMADVPALISLKLRNSGVIKTAGNNTFQTQLQDYQRVSDYYLKKAQDWEDRFNHWICDYESEIPEYLDNNDKGDVQSRSIRIKYGMFL